jgi:hypothetical protein
MIIPLEQYSQTEEHGLAEHLIFSLTDEILPSFLSRFLAMY